MLITYDRIANAMYIYLVRINPGGVEKTLSDELVRLELDAYEQIVAIRLYDSDKLCLKDRLKYITKSSHAYYSPDNREVSLAFTALVDVSHSADWSASLDLDMDDQIVGVELLFNPEFRVEEKMKYIRQYITSNQ